MKFQFLFSFGIEKEFANNPPNNAPYKVLLYNTEVIMQVPFAQPTKFQ